jgi:hypothetical protein
MLICNSAIGQFQLGQLGPQFQFGQLANWQFNPIQFTQFNEGNSIAVGLAKEAEINAASSSSELNSSCMGEGRHNVTTYWMDHHNVMTYRGTSQLHKGIN